MSRKEESIDLMKLYSLGSNNGWNQMLTDCVNRLDINRLAKIKYAVQAGMSDLASKKLNSEEMNIWFARLVKSLEQTAKQIIRIKHPMPADNPLIAKKHIDKVEVKRVRDRELMQFMQRSSY